MRNVLIAVLALMQPVCGFSQTSISVPTAAESACSPDASSKFPARRCPAPRMRPNRQILRANAAAPTPLSLKQAEALALKNNPQISVARLTALASEQVTREVRSNLWPSATAEPDRRGFSRKQPYHSRRA